MKTLYRIDDTLTNKISYYHLMLLFVSLPFDFFYCHVILISFAFHTLINTRRQQLALALDYKMLLMQSVFFVTLICTVYSAHKNEALQDVLRQISIFLFPLLLCFTTLNVAKYRSRLLLAFSICCTLTVAYLYIDALVIIHFFKYPLSTLFSKSFTNHNFSAPIAMHATFFSLQLGVALVYLLSVLIKENSSLVKIFYALCCCILIGGIVQLCSKAVFIALFISINICLPFFLIERKRRARFMVLSGIISLLLVVLIFKADTFKERYFTDLKIDLKEATSTTDDPRLERWGAALQLIVRKPIAGYGSGSELGILHDQFYARKLYNSFLSNLNAHNQYLSFLLVSGVLGLAVYLVTIVFGFRIAISKTDTVFFTFMMLIAVVSLSESFLTVEKGIYFYSLFLPFFVFSDVPKSMFKPLKIK